LNVNSQSNALANRVRCAIGAASSTLVRELQRNRNQRQPDGSNQRVFDPLTGLERLSSSEGLSSLQQRFGRSPQLCSIAALSTIGVPDELLALACTEVDPISAGTVDCSCGGGCAVDVGFLEDPDNRPYLWDLEEECP